MDLITPIDPNTTPGANRPTYTVHPVCSIPIHRPVGAKVFFARTAEVLHRYAGLADGSGQLCRRRLVVGAHVEAAEFGGGAVGSHGLVAVDGGGCPDGGEGEEDGDEANCYGTGFVKGFFGEVIEDCEECWVGVSWFPSGKWDDTYKV